MRKPPKGAAVLRGHLSEDGKHINVWCPYCNKYHNHGWTEKDKRDISHRAAECFDGSPFRRGGYYIGVLPRKGY